MHKCALLYHSSRTLPAAACISGEGGGGDTSTLQEKAAGTAEAGPAGAGISQDAATRRGVATVVDVREIDIAGDLVRADVKLCLAE